MVIRKGDGHLVVSRLVKDSDKFYEKNMHAYHYGKDSVKNLAQTNLSDGLT